MSLARAIKVRADDGEVVRQLQRIVERVASFCSTAEILAFGSLARGELTAESDLDVAVLVPDDINIDELKTAVRKGYVLSNPWPLDLLFLQKSHYLKRSSFGGVCFDIATDGVEIFPNWKLK